MPVEEAASKAAQVNEATRQLAFVTSIGDHLAARIVRERIARLTGGATRA
jgi:hypothetical protein